MESVLNVSKKFFKHLEKLKGSAEYQEALRDDGTLLVRPHHKNLYRLFLDNTSGPAASLLRMSLTTREAFKVWMEPKLTLKVQKKTFTINE